MASAHPILTCSESLAFEKKSLPSEALAWRAMQRAGKGVGRAILQDFAEIGLFPSHAKILLLLGKGHNTGDACIAAQRIRDEFPDVQLYAVFANKVTAMKPLALKAYEALAGRAINSLCVGDLENHDFALCIDGLLGMQFEPPLRAPLTDIIAAVNRHSSIALRAAVDLPSGLGTEDGFQADFTYATGIAKAPLFESKHARDVGRVRYVDIGFFDAPYRGERAVAVEVLSASVLQPLRALRQPSSDKRTFGHLFVVAGSRTMPGAMLMAVRAAVRSGVGLVTALVPESVVGYCAVVVPEAMWVPWPETPEGSLALAGMHLLLERIRAATGVLMGPGMGKERETQVLIGEVLQRVAAPIVLDADALTQEAVDAIALRGEDKGAVVVTPHAGEYQRIAGSSGDIKAEDFKWFCHKYNVIGVLKGPMCRVSDGRYVAYAPFGGPVLARGGSGDILAGLLGGLIAQGQTDPFTAVCQGTVWHGRAADVLARRDGQVAVATTDVLGCLSSVLRDVEY